MQVNEMTVEGWGTLFTVSAQWVVFDGLFVLWWRPEPPNERGEQGKTAKCVDRGGGRISWTTTSDALVILQYNYYAPSLFSPHRILWFVCSFWYRSARNWPDRQPLWRVAQMIIVETGQPLFHPNPTPEEKGPAQMIVCRAEWEKVR